MRISLVDGSKACTTFDNCGRESRRIVASTPRWLAARDASETVSLDMDSSLTPWSPILCPMTTVRTRSRSQSSSSLHLLSTVWGTPFLLGEGPTAVYLEAVDRRNWVA